MFRPPDGALGQNVILTWVGELRGCREGRHNAERAMLFPACVLARERGISGAAAIRRRIERRLQSWKDGFVAELAGDIVASAKGREGGGRAPRNEESVARSYHSMVINGKVREAVRNATSRGGGGLLHPDSTDAKSGKPVVDVLRDKHPAMRIPDAGADGVMAFEPYDAVPAPLPLDCSEAMAARVAKGLSGGAGPDSIDSRDLKGWLLYHKKASQALREELAAWVEWLANETPPWAAYRATKNCRLAVLDKYPGVRPVGIALVWDRAVCKCALAATGLNAKAACGSK